MHYARTQQFAYESLCHEAEQLATDIAECEVELVLTEQAPGGELHIFHAPDASLDDGKWIAIKVTPRGVTLVSVQTVEPADIVF